LVPLTSDSAHPPTGAAEPSAEPSAELSTEPSAELSTEYAERSGLVLLRSRGRFRGVFALLGPAFVAAVAYVDPGNFATNVSAGAQFGYGLAWVVLVANLMAMLVQYLSAKVGVATGRDLPELCRELFPRTVTRLLWGQAELIAIATDLAEFVGAAIGLNLLFHVPPLVAGLMTAVVAFGILGLQQRGYRRFELAITALLGIVSLGFAYDLAQVHADPASMAAGLVPTLHPSALLLVCGIIGATVMPHAIYLHSALTKDRVTVRGDDERRQLLKFQRLDVLVALGAAGLINLAMLFVAAALFTRTGFSPGNAIVSTHTGLEHLVGGGAALAFAVALLASGLSSSSVGTYAGQVVMQGFIRRRIPVFARRTLTMLPALVVLGLNLPATSVLVISQVVLSFGIPFALIPLVLLTRRADVMGALVNRRLTTAASFAVATVIVGLNLFLIVVTFAG
jgi:manganese transport protein